MFGLLLAAVAAATPSPAPYLAQLKTIATVRSTPECAALHERVGPAIASIIDSDAKIASGGPMFGSMYHDDVVVHSDLRMSFDVLRMENLITPIANDITAAKDELAHLPKDPDLDAVRAQLQAVLDKQNDALNVISGFVATYQLGELQGRTSAIAPASAASTPRPANGDDASAPGAKMLLNTGLPAAPGSPKAPSERSSNVNLGSSPYQSFASQLSAIGQKRNVAEQTASRAVIAAVDRCAAPPSTP